MITASIVLYNTTADQLATVVKSFEPSENRRLFLIDNNKEKNELYAKVASNAYISYIHNEKLSNNSFFGKEIKSYVGNHNNCCL